MARFDVHRYPVRGGSGYLLDVQADLLSGIATRVVVPLLPVERTRVIMPDLNPTFVIADSPYVMATTQLASIPRGELGAVVTTLRGEQFSIIRALDILLTGF